MNKTENPLRFLVKIPNYSKYNSAVCDSDFIDLNHNKMYNKQKVTIAQLRIFCTRIPDKAFREIMVKRR